MILLHAPPAPFVPEEWHGRKICAMVVCYSGDLDRPTRCWRRSGRSAIPVVDLLQRAAVRPAAVVPRRQRAQGRPLHWKTEYVAELSDGLLAVVRDVFAECPIPEGQVGFLHLGGALNERAEDDGAVGNRDARFAMGVIGMWEPGEPNADAFRQWVRDGWERVRPFSTGRTYINFQTADEDEERVRAAYGANFDRLVEIKTTYDPDNLFRSNRNIRPAGRGP